MLMNTLKNRKNISTMTTRIVMEELLECRHRMIVYITSDADSAVITCEMCKETYDAISIPSLLTGDIRVVQEGHRS